MCQACDNTDHSENKLPLSAEDMAAIEQLHAVVDREMQKPLEEQDGCLIDECIQTIAEIKGVRSAFTPEEIDTQIAIVQARAESGKATAVRRPKRVKTVLIAACLAVVMLAGAATAYAVSPAVRSWISFALQLEVGSPVTVDGVTYENMGIAKIYSSAEELLVAEQIDIFLPSKLPEGIELKHIITLDMSGKTAYSVKFSTRDLSLYIQIGMADAFSGSSRQEIYSTDVGTFYIHSKDGITTVTGIIGQDIYNITAKDYIDVKSLLDSFKGNTP